MSRNKHDDDEVKVMRGHRQMRMVFVLVGGG
jgi:hypothetical protein